MSSKRSIRRHIYRHLGISRKKKGTDLKSVPVSSLFTASGQFTMLAASLLLPYPALAAPVGGQVAAGSAAISRPDAITTIVNQQSDKAIINWQGFSIAPQELVRFQQPGNSSIALNRVLGRDPSQIFGRLEANGQVFLVNPNGVLFGPGSQVSVHGLLATTHNISDNDFLNGRYSFSRPQTPALTAEVINQGLLQAADHGYIVLAGDYTANEGIIQARLGQVALASGNRFTLDLDGDQLIGLAVDEASLAERAGVENFGDLTADGGQVLMTARVATELTSAVVNNEGLIRAQSIAEQNGEIILHGGTSGIVANSGNLDASGRGADETGGKVMMLGEKVGLLDQATVDVSGQAGGTALIGGDFQGKNPAIQNATTTFVGPETTIKADATENSGGKIIVWADGTTRAYGTISARGGKFGGDGGLVEVSGKRLLDFEGRVDTRAPLGKAGTLLLDPTNITIQAANPDINGDTTPGDDIANATDLDDATTDFAGVDSIITGIALGDLLESTDVTLAATNNITVNDLVQWSSATYDLAMDAGNDITVNSAIVSDGTAGGNITLVAGNGITLAANLTSTFNSTPFGTVAMTAGPGGINQTGGLITADLLNLTANGPVSIYQDGNFFNSLTANLTGGSGSTLDIKKSVAGPLNITNLSATGAVNINMAGALQQTNPITTPSLTVATEGFISLTNDSNAVNAINLSQTCATCAEITFHNGAPLVINNLLNNYGDGGNLGDIIINADGQITLDGVITTADTGGLVSLSTRTADPLLWNSGTIYGNTIQLQTTAGSTGAVTGSGSDPLYTSSIGGSGEATLQIGTGGNQVAGTNIDHTGDLLINAASGFAANSPVSLLASGNLTLSSPMTIDSGTADLSLSSTGLLTIPDGTTITTTGSLGLKTNRLAIGTTNGTVGHADALVHLLPATAGWDIDFGSVADDTATTLEISAAELGRISADTLLVGDSSAGDILLTDNVAPNAILKLRSGGAISQTGGVITADSLEINAAGNVSLPNANVITTIAASLSGQYSTFAYNSGDGFSVGSVGDSTGIQTWDGDIDLTANGGNMLQVAENILAGNGDISISQNNNGGGGDIDVAAGKTVSGTNVQIQAADIGGILTINGTVNGSGAVIMDTPGSIDIANNATVFMATGSSINAGTDLTISGTVGGSGTFEVVSDNDLTIEATGVITGANNSIMTVTADNDSSGVGDLTVYGGIGHGDGGANSGSMTIFGYNVFVDGMYAAPGGTYIMAHDGADQTITATNMLVVAGGDANDEDALIMAETGTQSITAAYLEIIGGSAANSQAAIVSSGGIQDISATDITIEGGSGLNAHATIGTIGDVSQSLTVADLLTITGGSGDGAFADIYQDSGAANQTIAMTGGGDIVITGGNAANGAFAAIHSGSSGTQSVIFTGGGNLNITGGTVGKNNWAEIGSNNGITSVTGNPDIILTGGATGTATTDEEGNSAELGSHNTVTIAANTLTMQGGAGNYSGAYLGGTDIDINVIGTTSLTGGSGTEAHAAIGMDEMTATSIALYGAGNISLDGTGGGLALIGSEGGLADITIEGADITANYAGIGSINDILAMDTFGIGSVYLYASGNLTLNESIIAGLATDAATPANGQLSLISNSGTLTLGPNTLIRGHDINLAADTLDVDATASIVAGSPASSYVYPDVGFVSVYPYTSTRPMNVAGTPADAGALNLTDAILARINPSGWMDGNGEGVPTGGGVGFGLTSGPLNVTGELFEPGDGMFINLRGSTITQASGAVIHDTLNATSGSGDINLPEGNTVSYLIASSAGNLTFNTETASLDIRNTSAAGDITITNNATSANAIAINQNVNSTVGGNIAITAGGNLTQAQGVTVSSSGAGGITVESLHGNITAGTGTIASTGTGSISYLASGNTTVTSSQLSTSGAKTVTGTPPEPEPEPEPTIAECIADPTITGCDAILPSIEECESDPTLPGCSVVLPSIDDCSTDPTLAGCQVVLPPLDDCAADPTLPGCSAVLPSIDDCSTDPTLAGCQVVLPPLDDCAADPTLPGCSAVLPSIDDCSTDPTLAGCQVVLPPLADCATDPTLPGCSAVLPPMDQCITNPSAPGCSTVLPSLNDCSADSSLPGCSAILPSLADCVLDPNAPGCGIVLPSQADCIANPAIPGCVAVLPAPTPEPPREVVANIEAVITEQIRASTETVSTPAPATPASSTPPATGDQPGTTGSDTGTAPGTGTEAGAETGSGSQEEEPRERSTVKAEIVQERPLAQQPIFNLTGGGIAGQQVVCK